MKKTIGKKFSNTLASRRSLWLWLNYKMNMFDRSDTSLGACGVYSTVNHKVDTRVTRKRRINSLKDPTVSWKIYEDWKWYLLALAIGGCLRMPVSLSKLLSGPLLANPKTAALSRVHWPWHWLTILLVGNYVVLPRAHSLLRKRTRKLQLQLQSIINSF